MSEDSEQGVDVGLRGKVKTGSDMPAWRGDPTGVTGVQPKGGN